MTQSANEPWAAWAESMQKMMASPAALNPFAGMMGLPGAGTGAAAFDPQQFMKAIDPVEIDRRIQDLRAVETWMKLSLTGLDMSIKTMEMQRDAYASFNKMTATATESVKAATEVPERTVRRAAARRR